MKTIYSLRYRGQLTRIYTVFQSASKPVVKPESMQSILLKIGKENIGMFNRERNLNLCLLTLLPDGQAICLQKMKHQFCKLTC